MIKHGFTLGLSLVMFFSLSATTSPPESVGLYYCSWYNLTFAAQYQNINDSSCYITPNRLVYDELFDGISNDFKFYLVYKNNEYGGISRVICYNNKKNKVMAKINFSDIDMIVKTFPDTVLFTNKDKALLYVLLDTYIGGQHRIITKTQNFILNETSLSPYFLNCKVLKIAETPINSNRQYIYVTEHGDCNNKDKALTIYTFSFSTMDVKSCIKLTKGKNGGPLKLRSFYAKSNL